MYLTKNDIARLPASSFVDVLTVVRAVSAHFGCGITYDTASRILDDYNAGLIVLTV